MKLKNIVLISLFLGYLHQTAAQHLAYQRDSSVKVFAYGQEQTLAWCGGFDKPQFSLADLNADGLPDLVSFEPYAGVQTFINKGTPGHPDYRLDAHYAANFPPVSDYLILKDYNCDGVPDLFHRALTGVSVYRGFYNANHELCFQFYKALFYFDAYSHSNENVYVPQNSLPAIVDIDNDGDLDIVTQARGAGNTLNLYKNLTRESGLPCDSIIVSVPEGCWGNAINRGAYYLLEDCSHDTSVHESAALCAFDYDKDGDIDLLAGNSTSNHAFLLTNGRIPYRPPGPDSMVAQVDQWPVSSVPVNLASYPAAYNLDMDNDGKNDLLFAPFSTSYTENNKCVLFYKNESTAGSTVFRFQSDSFLVDHSIDVGSCSYPALFDFNKDGKPDLFVGSDGYKHAGGTPISQLSYYQNTSTTGHPSFTLQTQNFLTLDTFRFQGSALAIGDINNDGISDLVIGHADGTLSLFVNQSASETVPPNWQLQTLAMTDWAGTTISVGHFAAPFIYDIDKDGLPDLVIGNENGDLKYYRNCSLSPGTVRLALSNPHLGGVQVDPRSTNNFSAPFIGRLDNSGIDYILSGSRSGSLYQYTGFQTGDTLATYPLLDSQYAYIDTTFSNYIHRDVTLGIGVYDYLRSTVAIGQIAGDSTYYMIVGNTRGGLELFKRAPVANTGTAQTTGKRHTLIFPNPVSGLLYIENVEHAGTASVFDLSGRIMTTEKTQPGRNHIDLSGFTPGTYLIQINDEQGSRENELVVKK